MSLEERSKKRKEQMTAHRARNHGEAEPLIFSDAWCKKIEGHYGESPAYWIDIDSPIENKQLINKPKHQEDARILKKVKELSKKKK